MSVMYDDACPLKTECILVHSLFVIRWLQTSECKAAVRSLNSLISVSMSGAHVTVRRIDCTCSRNLSSLSDSLQHISNYNFDMYFINKDAE